MSESDWTLFVGLLVDAIEAVLRADEDKVAARRAHAARVWMAARDPGWPFSFVNVCETLGVDGAALRAALFPVREEHVGVAPGRQARPARPRPQFPIR